MISSCFSLFLLAASASAHIKLQSPTPRDTTEDLELNQLSGPCGKGFDKSGSRTTVQLTGFSLNLQVADDKANTVVFGAIGDNPSSFPTQLATSTASLQNVNIPIDFSKLGAKAGDKVTIQIQETSSDGKKFVCADLVIAGSAPSSSAASSASATASASSTTTTAKPTSSAVLTNGGVVEKSSTLVMAAAAALLILVA